MPTPEQREALKEKYAQRTTSAVLALKEPATLEQITEIYDKAFEDMRQDWQSLKKQGEE